MSKGTIVLAHGIFGFGDLIPGFQPVHYFNGVESFLEDQDWNVVVPTVDPVGHVEKRAGQLIQQIPQAVPEPLHIIAHSMGGLDARRAFQLDDNLAGRVKTLVTIGTPHQGSPVADAVADGKGPLASELPQFVHDMFGNTDAIQDLTSDFCRDFNSKTPDIKTIEYINIAGDASLANNQFVFFELAALIRERTGKINDGMVTKASALREGERHLDDWPVDHIGEIGWSLGSPVPIAQIQVKLNLLLPSARSHLARYEAIAKLLSSAS
ncbi:MAG TPA: hypothetical protein VKH81_14575 [Candidatus Angelobacter sp.]|nr:hypothetical protein [Candidatus Angelobacter sp.]